MSEEFPGVLVEMLPDGDDFVMRTTPRGGMSATWEIVAMLLVTLEQLTGTDVAPWAKQAEEAMRERGIKIPEQV